MEVEKVSNDVMMMWHGTHCGSLRTYFTDKDIFETARDLEKKSASKNQDGGKPFLKRIERKAMLSAIYDTINLGG
jgi:hypothetical protein